MKKYDCTKTLDFSHECRRMCNSMCDCEGCPLCKPCPEMGDITAEHIAILQEWSDEHPEPPKLTKREYDFLTSFDAPALSIERRSSDRLYVIQHSPVDVNAILIDPNSFSFIPVGEVWYFTKLLNLEVEE